MIAKPMIRSNICLNSHPKGCASSVRSQIEYAQGVFKGQNRQGMPRLALIIGCSTGYGLASRIAAAYGYGAATVGISFEKAGTDTKSGTPGWYNNLTFDKDAALAGLKSKTLNGDAFSNELKTEAIAAVKDLAQQAKLDAKIDLVIYSLASPVRTDPATGIMHKSVIKPIGGTYCGRTFDMVSGKINTVSVEPANDEEIANTVKVMGGEDWELWIQALDAAGVLAPKCRTVAYTYIGPELSWEIYKNGTIGRAKEDLQRAAKEINKKYAAGSGAAAWVSVNKAVVTRASAVIPIIPLYISCLFKVMKEKKLHEGCIEQICRLYKDFLYADAAAQDNSKVPVDAEGRIRIDDFEMRSEVQAATVAQMDKLTEENIFEQSDAAGFKHDFLEAHGFDIAGIDYDAEVDPSGI
ncbi:MAG: trans-2-enoyl-CoA reductase family protein [Termitinemataceae bacterium]|nr:MAG: trans-2-enoyl-CoA reductase family protein [Termitinemataceae bacterium]